MAMSPMLVPYIFPHAPSTNSAPSFRTKHMDRAYPQRIQHHHELEHQPMNARPISARFVIDNQLTRVEYSIAELEQ